MSKMKHLLRKLHIGGGFNDHNNRLAATDTPSQPPATTQFHSSSSPTPLPTIGTVDSLAVVDNNDSSAVDFNFFEVEFQMQLALAISVSSGSAEAREPDTETAQIKAAKQRSLGCSPSESLIEFVSLRYWGFWRGNVPALLMVMPYTAIQFMVLHKVKTIASGSSKSEDHIHLSPYLSFMSGALAGCAATVGSYPFDLIRTILASQGEPKETVI